MEEANEKEINGKLWKEGGKVESIKNLEGTSQTQVDDVTHEIEAYDDVPCDMATYLVTWYDDVEPCGKPNKCQIMNPTWVEFDLNQVSSWSLV